MRDTNTTTPTYTTADLAEVLRVHPRTVSRLIASGRLGHVRVGRQIRFTQRQIDAYLASVEVRPAEFGRVA